MLIAIFRQPVCYELQKRSYEKQQILQLFKLLLLLHEVMIDFGHIKLIF